MFILESKWMFVPDVMKLPPDVPEISHSQEWDVCEVTVTLTFDHQNQMMWPNLKKFPQGVPEILYSREWDGQMDGWTTPKT